ncbi:MAG: tetratricopeptide repeat protein [Myxococcota bacterium]|nr:tetratricopeptide repeat protein [Myxococcota bacterium]
MIRIYQALAISAVLGVGGLHCGEQRDQSAQIERIVDLQSKGRYRESVISLREMLDQSPDDPELNHLYGLALLSTGRPSLAVWSLRKASESEEFAVRDGLLLGRALMRGGSAEDAVAAASRVLEVEPENLEALRLRLEANLGAMKNVDALGDIELILEIEPDDLETHVARIRALLTLDQVEDAAAAIEDVNQRVQNMEDAEMRSLWLPRVCGGSASFADERGDPDGAEGVWNDCLTQFPEETMIVNAAVEFFDSRGEPMRSLEIMRKANELRPKELDSIMPLANRLANMGKPEEAEALLRAAAEESNSPDRIWITIAGFHEERNEPAKARDALYQVLNRKKSAPVDMVGAYADLLIRAGDYDQVEAVLVDLKDEPVMQALLRGRLQLALGNPQEALVNLEEGLRLWPSNTAARYLAGQAAEQLGDYNRALKEYMESHRAEHGNKEPVMRLTQLLEAMGRGEEVLAVLNRYNMKKPSDPEVLLAIVRIGHTHNNEQAFNVAMEKINKIPGQQGAIAAELARLRAQAGGPSVGAAMLERSGLDFTHPSNHQALDQFVTYLIQLNRTPAAINLSGSAARTYPDMAEFHEIHGRALLASGAQAEAREAFEQALIVSPNKASALAKLAALSAAEGNPEAALALYDQATEADPLSADYPWQATRLVMASGKTAEARKRLESLTRLHGEHPEASRQLALILMEEDPDRSLALARQAVRFRGGPTALTTLGQIQLGKGQPERAQKTLNRSLELRPDSPSTRYWLAKAMVAQGDSAAAQESLTQALESPAFPERAQAVAELEALRTVQ